MSAIRYIENKQCSDPTTSGGRRFSHRCWIIRPSHDSLTSILGLWPHVVCPRLNRLTIERALWKERSRRRSGSPVSRRFQHTTWDSTCGGRLVYVKRRTGLWANERPLYKFRHIRHGNPYFSANRKGPGAESELRSRAEIADRPAGRSEPGWNLTTVSGSQRHGSIEEYRTL